MQRTTVAFEHGPCAAGAHSVSVKAKGTPGDYDSGILGNLAGPFSLAPMTAQETRDEDTSSEYQGCNA